MTSERLEPLDLPETPITPIGSFLNPENSILIDEIP